jgi:uncharacterized protein YdaU (DUF1376 family)
MKCPSRSEDVNDEYDPTADFARSIDECYRAIRERVDAGGSGWGGWPAGVHADPGGQGFTQQPRPRPDSFSSLAVEDRAAPLPTSLHRDAGASVMKWYKHDPSAALAGMAGLTVEERGAYYTVIDAFYDRDGHLPDDDYLVSRILGCNPRTWRKLKISLFQKQKITVNSLGNLVPNRGEHTLNEARMFSETQANRARKRWEQPEKHNESNSSSMPLLAYANTTTTTTTSTPRKNIDSSLCKVGEAPTPSVQVQVNYRDPGNDYRSPPRTKSSNVLEPHLVAAKRSTSEE